jgi:hypothetical protein
VRAGVVTPSVPAGADELSELPEALSCVDRDDLADDLTEFCYNKPQATVTPKYLVPGNPWVRNAPNAGLDDGVAVRTSRHSAGYESDSRGDQYLWHTPHART